MKNYFWLILTVLIALPTLAIAASDATFVYQGTPRIVDGDSIFLGNTEMRLLCIDAVELHQTCRDAHGAEYACGIMARDAMSRSAAGRHVSCNGKAHDKYKRPLAWCSAGDVDLNAKMVEQGWAVSTCGKYRELEDAARAAKIGIWQGTFDLPWDWRHAHPWHPANDNNRQ